MSPAVCQQAIGQFSGSGDDGSREVLQFVDAETACRPRNTECTQEESAFSEDWRGYACAPLDTLAHGRGVPTPAD
jgi:hypothetical protein